MRLLGSCSGVSRELLGRRVGVAWESLESLQNCLKVVRESEFRELLENLSGVSRGLLGSLSPSRVPREPLGGVARGVFGSGIGVDW